MTACGVLFDLDGVLVDSASLHVQAYEQVFEWVGLPFVEAAREAVRSGKPRAEVLNLALPADDQSLKKELARAKPEALRRLLEGRTDCGMPGAIESVHALSRAGIPMAVVTNSRTPELWLDKLDISRHICVIVSGDEVSSPKPSPEGYLLGAKRLRISPGRCLAIEDSLDGYMAARSAGMQVAVLANERPLWLDADTHVIAQLDAARILRWLDLISAAHP